MNQLYARVFTQILDSSLAEDWQARHVFEDLLKLADDGIVDMTRQAIARRTNAPLQIINDAIAKLEAPDPASRDAAEDGRRLVRLDDHRDWGWRIVNWGKYEEVKTTLDQKFATAERVRRFREKQKVSPAPLPKAKAEAEAEADRALQNVTGRYKALQSVTERVSSASPSAPCSRPDGRVTGGKAKLKQEEESDPEVLAFMNGWIEAYEPTFSRAYVPKWGHEGKAVKELRKVVNLSAAELLEVARQAWASKTFWCQKAVTVATFCSRWNEITAELSGQSKTVNKVRGALGHHMDSASPYLILPTEPPE